ncbi:MAG: hypothetical protein JO257_22270 [Deltaproteobacteria bacterium]|nr:hypothetical protein [Deltaproteobacteria bacterium]
MSAHTVTVKVEPDGIAAKIVVAGQPVSGDSLTLTESHGFASVAVTAPGYFPYRKLIELRGKETTVVVKLIPLPSQKKKPMPFVLLALVVIALVKLVTTCA